MTYWRISAEKGSISPEDREINISVMGKPIYISKSLITSRMKENFRKNQLEVSIDSI